MEKYQETSLEILLEGNHRRNLWKKIFREIPGAMEWSFIETGLENVVVIESSS